MLQLTAHSSPGLTGLTEPIDRPGAVGSVRYRGWSERVRLIAGIARRDRGRVVRPRRPVRRIRLAATASGTLSRLP